MSSDYTNKPNQQWILKERPSGEFDPSKCFEKKEAKVPELKEGEVLAQNLYLSFDPTQRPWMEKDTYAPAVPIGDSMRSFGIAQVLVSKNPKFGKGDRVFGMVNWQEYVVFNPDAKDAMFDKIPGHVDSEQFLSIMITGVTAYFGLLYVGQPKSGDTVVVSGAAGATGSFAAQIARIKGCKVIGIAGGEEKCKWLTETAKLDAAINYKTDNIQAKLKELCPNGVNVYFDNVGGKTLEAVLENLALHARVVCCGMISQYEKKATETDSIPNLFKLIETRSKMQGFLVMDYKHRMVEAIVCLDRWMKDGKIKYEMDVQHGFDEVPNTLKRLLDGKNHGKQMLKLTDQPLPSSSNATEQSWMKFLGSFFGFWRSI